MPKQLFDKLCTAKKPLWSYGFLSVIIVGLIGHMYRMTNWLPNWDGLVFRDDPQHMATLGRWFLSVPSKLSTDFELPWLAGLLALLYLGIAVIFLLEILGVRSRLSAVLLGGVVAVFPAVISTFAYCYVVDSYCFAFLLAVVAAWCLLRKKIGWAILGTVLLTLSVGCYQAYLTVTIELLTVWLILRLFDGTLKPFSALRHALKFCICGGCAMGLYYVLQNAIVALFGMEVLDYQGVSEALSFESFSLFRAVRSVLVTYGKFFFDYRGGINLYIVLNIAVFALLIWHYGGLLVHGLRQFGRVALIAVLALSIPFGSCILYFVNPGLDYHTLMTMGFLTPYLLLIMIYDGIDVGTVIARIKAWGTVIVTAVLICNLIAVANVSYHKLQLSFDKSYGILIRMATEIESIPGGTEADDILVVGQLAHTDSYAVNFPPKIVGVTDGLILFPDDESVRQSVLTASLKDYCDLDYHFLAGDEAAALRSTAAVRSMPCWPDRGSIAVKDGTLIIKLSNPEGDAK